MARTSRFRRTLRRSPETACQSISASGSGYVTSPAVKISGGGGSGATAEATSIGGNLTGVTITNPGTGLYFAAHGERGRRQRHA